ncbi:hypothetical protein NKDENANG_00149 [Candidatus Entotheonellaceae bacterium PAL068K]
MQVLCQPINADKHLPFLAARHSVLSLATSRLSRVRGWIVTTECYDARVRL